MLQRAGRAPVGLPPLPPTLSPFPGSPAEAQVPPGAARGHREGKGVGEDPWSRPATRPQRPRSPRKHTVRRWPAPPVQHRTSAAGAGPGARGGGGGSSSGGARGSGAGLAGVWAGPGPTPGQALAQAPLSYLQRMGVGSGKASSLIILLRRRGRVPAPRLIEYEASTAITTLAMIFVCGPSYTKLGAGC